MRAALKAIQAAAGNAGSETSDDNFNNVTLLLDGDGTDAADNNTFTDGGASATVTVNGTIEQGSFSPYGNNWSVEFDGTSNSLLVFPGGTNYNINDSDFTAEVFVKGKGDGTRVIAAKGSLSGSSSSSWWIETVSGTLRFYVAGTSGYTILYDDVAFSTYDEKWVHIACVNDSGTSKLFVNGTLKDSATTPTTVDSTANVSIGGSDNGSYSWKGLISNVRISTSAIYTSDFTVPTTRLLDDGGRRLVACALNQYNSAFVSHGQATTVGTALKVSPQHPFLNTEARSLSTNGGSAYFSSGDSDYLKVTGPGNQSDMTVSCWFYCESTAQVSGGGYPRIFSTGNYSQGGALLLYLRDDNTIRIYQGGEVAQANIKLNQWHYVVAQRSSSTWSLYLDGSLIDTGTKSTAVDTSTYGMVVGATANPLGSYHYTGYVADLQVVSDADPTPTTVPTSPVSADADSILLYNFQDANIFDYSGINNFATIGNAEIDTAVKKFGTGSLKFDGSGDRLIEASTKAPFNTGDFTVEAWVNFGSVSQDSIVSTRSGTGTTSDGFLFTAYQSKLQYYINGSFLTGTTTLSTGQWYHVAVVRDNGTVKLFLDGTLENSRADTNDLTSTILRVGSDINSNYDFSGYIDDIRITNGVARYTSNFSVPTGAHPKF